MLRVVKLNDKNCESFWQIKFIFYLGKFFFKSEKKDEQKFNLSETFYIIWIKDLGGYENREIDHWLKVKSIMIINYFLIIDE